MLRLDLASKALVPVSSTTLTQKKVLERLDLQAAITRSWDHFCSEIGYEELFFIGAEVTPHDSCANRIDLLALNRDGTPVIIELKRHRDRLQLLQGISYAAMIARWDKHRFSREVEGRDDEDADELRSLLLDDNFALNAPEIVLVAESFDPEVILAADWLGGFNVPIYAFVISALEHKGDTLISFDQRFPLPGLDDVYVRRAQRTVIADPTTSWEDALRSIQVPFARRAVETFRRLSEGSPNRRAFFSIYAGSPLGRMRITFKRKHLTIYTVDQSAEAEEALRISSGRSPSRSGAARARRTLALPSRSRPSLSSISSFSLSRTG
jgi:hypothetical protein